MKKHCEDDYSGQGITYNKGATEGEIQKESEYERKKCGIPLSIATIKQTQLSVKNEDFKTLNRNLLLRRQLLL